MPVANTSHNIVLSTLKHNSVDQVEGHPIFWQRLLQFYKKKPSMVTQRCHTMTKEYTIVGQIAENTA